MARRRGRPPKAPDAPLSALQRKAIRIEVRTWGRISTTALAKMLGISRVWMSHLRNCPQYRAALSSAYSRPLTWRLNRPKNASDVARVGDLDINQGGVSALEVLDNHERGRRSKTRVDWPGGVVTSVFTGEKFDNWSDYAAHLEAQRGLPEFVELATALEVLDNLDRRRRSAEAKSARLEGSQRRDGNLSPPLPTYRLATKPKKPRKSAKNPAR